MAYQHENYIREALDSLLAQTCMAFKLVAIDDGSKDGTYSILKDYESGPFNGRMSVLTHPGHANCGIYAGYRRCLEELDTEFFMPHASDDCLSPSAIEFLLSLMDSNPSADFAYGPCEVIDAHGIAKGYGDGCTDVGEGLVALQTILNSNPVREPTMFFRARCSNVISDDCSNILYGDWLHNLLFFTVYKPRRYSRSVVMYRVHGENVSLGDHALLKCADRRYEVLLAALSNQLLARDKPSLLLILLSGLSTVPAGLDWPSTTEVAKELLNASRSDISAVIRTLSLEVARTYPLFPALSLSWRAVEIGKPCFVYYLLNPYLAVLKSFFVGLSVARGNYRS